VSKIAEEAGLSRKGVQKALPKNGNPALSGINAIMHAMGYRLSPQKLSTNTEHLTP
jgi:DNA-binding phage protein